jgi:hypothetical protein
VSQNEGITDDIRRREEEYFRRKDRELIDKMRRVSDAAQARKTLEQQTGIHDPAMLNELEQLGFTPETMVLLPLMPVLRVAWAESGVSTSERKAILDLARVRGVVDGSVADQQLRRWLDQRPSADTFDKATRLIGAMIGDPEQRRADLTAEDLLKYCEQIAHASGGLFGIGTVSVEERNAMQAIAAQLKNRT